MKVASLSRAKDDLSRYVAYVRKGGRVRIMVSGVPAADMVPVTGRPTDAASDEDLTDLERHGVLRRGTGGIPPEILRPLDYDSVQVLAGQFVDLTCDLGKRIHR